MSETVFSKIISGEIPSSFVYEDELCVVINDLNPVAPYHWLVIPKQATAKLSDYNSGDENVLGHLLMVGKKVASDHGLDNFRCVINNGEGAGQSVFHVHVHIIGGRAMSWPPG